MFIVFFTSFKPFKMGINGRKKELVKNSSFMRILKFIFLYVQLYIIIVSQEYLRDSQKGDFYDN